MACDARRSLMVRTSLLGQASRSASGQWFALNYDLGSAQDVLVVQENAAVDIQYEHVVATPGDGRRRVRQARREGAPGCRATGPWWRFEAPPTQGLEQQSHRSGAWD
jgi:hypothetical protein